MNSITIQVMLSAPSPSDYARFIGHILSIIISTIREITTGFPALPAFPVGEPPEAEVEAEFDLEMERAEAEGVDNFLAGDTTPLRTPAIPRGVLEAGAFNVVLDEVPFLSSFCLVS